MNVTPVVIRSPQYATMGFRFRLPPTNPGEGEPSTRDVRLGSPMRCGAAFDIPARGAGLIFPGLVNILGTNPLGKRAGASGLSAINATRPALQILRRLRALRTLFSTARLKLRQKSTRCRADAFHFTPSAGKSGLAALLDGHQQSRRKQGNVRFSTGEIQHEQR